MTVLVPDLIEPIVGWRAWYVRGQSGGFEAPRLASLGRPFSWPERAPARALCQRATSQWYGHEAPHPGCECGIYASRESELAAGYLIPTDNSGYVVLGRVKLWGSVIDCERGWRASCAYPEAFAVPMGSKPLGYAPPRILEQLAGAYGVGVVEVEVKSPILQALKIVQREAAGATTAELRRIVKQFSAAVRRVRKNRREVGIQSPRSGSLH